MPFEQIYVLGILALLVVLLVTERLPSGITGLLVVAALALGEIALPGRVAPGRAPFLGLVNSAVLAVAALFVVSAGIVRTGALGLVSERLLERKGARPERQFRALLILVAVLSGLMNNTPLVLIFMPVFIGLASRMEKPPSKVLIPLSFAAILGGLTTKIGTSTNIVVASAVEGRLEIGMFDFTPVGLVLAAAGVLLLIFFAPRLLPERTALGLDSSQALSTEYMTEIEVKSGSAFAGKTVGEVFAGRGEGKNRVRVLQIIRGDVIQSARRDVVVEAGDLMLVKGDPATILEYHVRSDTGVNPKLNEEGQPAPDIEGPRRVAMTLVEVIVTPNSRFLDARVSDVRFRERWGVAVVAIQRHGSHLREKVEELRLKPGDILLIQGSVKAIQNLKVSKSFLVVEGVQRAIPHTAKAPLALAVLLGFVVAAVFLPQSVHVVALAAAMVMVLGRCLSSTEAYDALDWDILFLLGGTIALGGAMEHTGLADRTAGAVVEMLRPFGPWAAIVGIYLTAAVATELLSNNAVAAVLAPLAFKIGLGFAAQSQSDPDPRSALPFVMAVAFGASSSFLTPIGYQTNLIVYGPGGYRFTDFLRVGLPFTLLLAVLAGILIPLVYGLP